jgi:multiple sugar transport system permease protein
LFNALLNLLGQPDVLWLSQRSTALPAILFMTLAGGGGASVVLYLAAMGAIPADLYEVAEIDGANDRQKFWNITLPLLKPTTLYLLVVGVIGTIQFFTPVYILTDGGPANATVSLGLLIYRYAFRFNRLDLAATLGMLMFLVTILIVFALYRLFFSEIEY